MQSMATDQFCKAYSNFDWGVRSSAHHSLDEICMNECNSWFENGSSNNTRSILIWQIPMCAFFFFLFAISASVPSSKLFHLSAADFCPILEAMCAIHVYLITFWKIHGITEWMILAGISGDCPVQFLCSGWPGLCPVGYWIFSRMKTPPPLWVTCPYV